MQRRSAKHEEGVALLITVMMVLLTGVLALMSIEHSGSEMVAGSRARSTSRTLHAADGGMQLAFTRVSQSPPNLNPIDILIGNIDVESRTRAETSAQNIEFLGTGASPEGYGVNVGSGYSSELYQVDITSLAPNGSTAQLQSKFYTFEATPSGY